jgi:hypothetical protein
MAVDDGVAGRVLRAVVRVGSRDAGRDLGATCMHRNMQAIMMVYFYLFSWGGKTQLQSA